MKNKHRVCSRLIFEVSCDGKDYILMVENQNGTKGFPTAEIKTTETPQNAILRRLPEETGLMFHHEQLGEIQTCQKDYFFCIKKTYLQLPKLYPKKVVSADFVLKELCEDTINTKRQKKVFRKYIQESKV